MFQYGYASSYINTAQATFMNYLNHSVVKRYDVQLSESSVSWIWSTIVNSDQVSKICAYINERYESGVYVTGIIDV